MLLPKHKLTTTAWPVPEMLDSMTTQHNTILTYVLELGSQPSGGGTCWGQEFPPPNPLVEEICVDPHETTVHYAGKWASPPTHTTLSRNLPHEGGTNSCPLLRLHNIESTHDPESLNDETVGKYSPSGQSSPGTLQSGQQPSNGMRHIPQLSSLATQRHVATPVHSGTHSHRKQVMGNTGSGAATPGRDHHHKPGDPPPSSPGKDGGQAFVFDKKPATKLVFQSSHEEEEPYYTKDQTQVRVQYGIVPTVAPDSLSLDCVGPSDAPGAQLETLQTHFGCVGSFLYR
uniref:Uncharacterized protein n=1 Tax=Timema cristinae TaxID=61476 RepID=A0A7R9DA86_TIMCR|nr:unnamed protein product [Timema cristinae]